MVGVSTIIESDRQASVVALRNQLKRAFKKIKDEFNHHLEEINANTSEIQSNYEYTTELDARLDKIASRLEHVEIFLKKLDDSFKVAEEISGYNLQPLSVNEKRIFTVIYSSEKAMAYEDIAQALSMTDSLVRSYLTNIISKGIPIIKKYVNGKPVITLDEEFKHLQQEQNIVKLSQKQLDAY